MSKDQDRDGIVEEVKTQVDSVLLDLLDQECKSIAEIESKRYFIGGLDGDDVITDENSPARNRTDRDSKYDVSVDLGVKCIHANRDGTPDRDHPYKFELYWDPIISGSPDRSHVLTLGCVIDEPTKESPKAKLFGEHFAEITEQEAREMIALRDKGDLRGLKSMIKSLIERQGRGGSR